MSRILMVASEAVPFAKSGGLGDVIGALPSALVSQGEEVAVVLPRYGDLPLSGMSLVAGNVDIWLGSSSYKIDIYEAVQNGVPFFLVDCPYLYDRDGLYTTGGKDYPDNHVRFAVLARAALAVVRFLYRPQIIHCHDWQSALVLPYIRRTFATDPTFLGIKSVLTIHNLGFQGRFHRSVMPEIGLDESLFTSGVMEFDRDVNFLKAGIQIADAVTTVSRGYAREIQTPEYGFDLDVMLRVRADSLYGILNGVDYSEWNPENDPHIASAYSAEDPSGKKACKKALLEEFGLPTDDLKKPAIGIVSRFATQKGFDLIEEIAEILATEDLFLVALGTGEPHFEEMFRGLAAEHPSHIAVRVAYDNAVAHRIEAGADMFLMPSHYEPCGLNQIYSLRYGTVPIVRATGGLDDTIDETTGFKFQTYDAESLLAPIREALTTYRDRSRWLALMRTGMKKDYSWKASAREYSALYRKLLGPPGSAPAGGPIPASASPETELTS